MKCINLKERFGDRYKVEYEESYDAEHSEHGRAEDPWLMLTPCRHGFICPWGAENLAACTKTAGSVAKRLKALPFTTVIQDGDDGANVMFHVKHFDAVARIMKPCKRRRLSAEHRARLAEAGAKSRFTHGVQAPKSARKQESAAQTVP